MQSESLYFQDLSGFKAAAKVYNQQLVGHMKHLYTSDTGLDSAPVLLPFTVHMQREVCFSFTDFQHFAIT